MRDIAQTGADLEQPSATSFDVERRPRFQFLRGVIERAGELLPSQGPLSGFVFLNTLQALEILPFEDGVAKGARLFGCQPYLTEDQYREKLLRGRIVRDDLQVVLREALGDRADKPIGELGTRIDLRMAMLEHPLLHGPTDELRWFVTETDALTRPQATVPPLTRKRLIRQTRRWIMRDVCGAIADRQAPHRHARDPRLHELLADLIARYGEATIESWSEATWEAMTVQVLWRLCRNGVHGLETLVPPAQPGVRHRDALLQATGIDSDALVHEVLIPFCQAFTDQGYAQWSLPDRQQGLMASFRRLHAESAGPPNHWLYALPEELARIELAALSPLDSVAESLRLLGVVEDEWDDYITSTLLALKGWAGTIRQMEVRGDRFAVPAAEGSLIELLAVRLILERLALADVTRKHTQYDGPLNRLRDWLRSASPRHEMASIEQRAFPLFQLAQVRGWSPPRLCLLSKKDWSNLVAEVESFSSLERRRTFHLAFERRYRLRALDALSIRGKRKADRVATPRFQAVFCIDTREESLRRHLEETAPLAETFGAAGFFGVPMYYRGLADAHFSALCPIVIRPKHWVTEEVVFPLEDSHRRQVLTRRAWGTTTRQVHLGSRSIARGALLTAGLGVLASVPLVARVLFPRLTAGIRRTASRIVSPPPITRLRLERLSATPGPEEDQIGFTVDEMAQIGGQFLRDIGLTDNFANLVFFIGHGAACLNNPHKSAYDCGACSGGAGGPNARALAAMLNDSRVRRILERQGMLIPDETRFIGGLHNTTSDTISFYDLDLVPRRSLPEFRAVRDVLRQVCERNAHERCRRFYSAPLNLAPAAAHQHVEGRAEDLAQTRPEFGNATNAVCVVGRRGRTRGLFLDRRSFLVSYDPTGDDAETSILQRTLGAVVPVCVGINLQYFFSHVDPAGWGSGTKLPHNVTSLVGVMDGAASDLRTGLPWQGVEIHEPLRLLLVVEATPATMRRIMERNEVVGRILRNGWVQLAVLDPETAAIRVLQNDEFVPHQPETTTLPKASSSVDWYRGWRDHLEFAEIGS